VSAQRNLRVLIVDDEPLARQRLEDLLHQEAGVEIVGTADNGDAAVQAIRDWKPDLLFLDVQMPGKTGLDVVREIGADAMPATIFVTAYDQYALKAFEMAAVDYVVKPFDDERFEQAFRRARRMVELEEVGRLRSQLLAVLQGGSPAAAVVRGDGAPRTDYLERIAVETKGQVRVVPVKQIDYIMASGPYAELHVGEKRYIIRERMQTLEERLDPARFFRIHRSAIVRLDLVETLLRNPGGDYALQLKGGVRLKVSRSRFEELEKRMGIGK
jgi:two-component system, LytTR family, response regulator